MVRIFAGFLGGVVVGVAAVWLFSLREAQAPPTPASGNLEQSLDGLAASIVDAGAFVRQHPWFGSEQEQTEAYQHILRLLVNGLEGNALSDPDFPFFQEINTRTKAGMDNSDQRYLIARLDGDAVYRVWGSRGSSRRLDFTVYGEDDMAPSISWATTEDLEVSLDGTFELFVGGAKREGNWLASEPGTVRLLIRQIHADWPVESPGDIHIDRVDDGRPDYPVLDPATLAARIDATSQSLARAVRRWPELGRSRLAAFLPANSLTPPRDTGMEGGLSGRLMVGGHWELSDDEALIVTTWPSAARYQGIQLGNHWWQSLDYANRQSSLTTDQARLSSDGAYHFVLSARDPGVPNWLDTEGLPRGIIMMRYDGLQDAELPEEEHPTAEVVSFDEVIEHLPADEPRIDAAARAAQIAARREHVQKRFHY